MKPILEIQNVSKKYRIQHLTGGYLNLRERMTNMLRFEKKEREDFWALRDVSFQVEPGESLGIIGRNGAGKSTLLKILSRITPPSHGRIISRGRIASLLEVGTGFHPELTGRENIFFNGSLLGMKRKEIETRFDEIVDFSGTGKFLDTALKHYSSGMQLRLAFAVAAFLDPEVLIIDEVLAVGDAEFQKKCLGKMEDVSKSGRTILFVSHNMTAVRSLCSKAIMIEKGNISYSGSAAHVIDNYLALSNNQNVGSNGVFDLTMHTGKKDITKGVLKARLLKNGKATSTFFSGEPFRAEFDFQDVQSLKELVFGVVIKDSNQQPVIGINNWDLGVKLNNSPVNDGTVVFELDSLPLYGESLYYVDLYFGDGGNNYDTIENALSFKLEPGDVFGRGKILNTKINTVYPGRVRMFCQNNL
jgi:lipopolysaccharide transport system ATP-binding protein